MKLINLKSITFTLLFGIFINPIFSQNLTKTINKIKIYGLHSVEYKYDIDLEKNDTNYVRIYISFLNSEFGKTVVNSLSLSTKDKVNRFIKDLKKSLEFIGKKQTITISGDNYKLSISEDFSKTLYIENSDGDSKNIYKKEIIKLVNWFESLDLSYLND